MEPSTEQNNHLQIKEHKIHNIIKRLYTNFENLSTEDKFIWLLSCEDKEIILLTSKLLIDLFKERKQRIT
jgi:hypothetical protein